MSETLKGSGSFTVDIAHRKKLLAAERAKIRNSYLQQAKYVWAGNNAGDHVLPAILGAIMLLVLTWICLIVIPALITYWKQTILGLVAATGAYAFGKLLWNCDDLLELYIRYRRELKNIYLE